jgi:hypothetical protein
MDAITNDILQLAALVAAYVGVIKAIGNGTKYDAIISKLAPVFAIGIAAVFVLVPDAIQTKITLISVVGLTSAGAYHFTKPKTEASGGTTKADGDNP